MHLLDHIPYLLFLSVVEVTPFPAQVQPVTEGLFTKSHLNTTSNTFIECYPPERTTFTPAFCADVFFQIRSLADFPNTQQFLEGVRPQIDPGNPDSKPPFGFADELRECTLILRSRRHTLSDEFSWQQVNQLGWAITKECPRQGGFGYIGEARRWMVKLGAPAPQRSGVRTKIGVKATVAYAGLPSLSPP